MYVDCSMSSSRTYAVKERRLSLKLKDYSSHLPFPFGEKEYRMSRTRVFKEMTQRLLHLPFCSHCIGLNLFAWSHLTAREAGKKTTAGQL